MGLTPRANMGIQASATAYPLLRHAIQTNERALRKLSPESLADAHEQLKDLGIGKLHDRKHPAEEEV